MPVSIDNSRLIYAALKRHNLLRTDGKRTYVTFEGQRLPFTLVVRTLYERGHSMDDIAEQLNAKRKHVQTTIERHVRRMSG
jgi:DNA-binding NarL/FixJ family response regulator